ncbi:MAG TPA: alkaline phosphatase family protein [Longimicrobiales bacterium]|nr:alkaline phosphatase family protein [Longimicrobiales bacterium]
MTRPRVLLFFVDGVGLGVDDSRFNPFSVAQLPTFTELLGGVRVASGAAPQQGTAATLVAVDAVLGMEGTPQSGTGQATLLTGTDAVALHGGHFGPWVPARLRSLVRERSVLAQAQGAGLTAAFANAYPEEVNQAAADGKLALPSDDRAVGTLSALSGRAEPRVRSGRERRASSFLRAGPPLAALGAGLLTRHTPELVLGDAVASELTNEGWREHLGREDVPLIDAVNAGRNLARIAVAHDLTLFAHYATDYAGHRRDMEAAVQTLERLDSFLEGLLDQADGDLLILMASDHGNIEDVRTGHTRNPALGLVIGTDHQRIASRLTSLTDIGPAIMRMLTSQQQG